MLSVWNTKCPTTEGILEETWSSEKFQFRRQCHPFPLLCLRRNSTNKVLMPTKVWHDGPLHWEGNTCYPFLSEFCPNKKKRKKKRKRERLPLKQKIFSGLCWGSLNRLPFHLPSEIFLSGLKNFWIYFIRLHGWRKGQCIPTWLKRTDDVHIFFKATCNFT